MVGGLAAIEGKMKKIGFHFLLASVLMGTALLVGCGRFQAIPPIAPKNEPAPTSSPDTPPGQPSAGSESGKRPVDFDNDYDISLDPSDNRNEAPEETQAFDSENYSDLVPEVDLKKTTPPPPPSTPGTPPAAPVTQPPMIEPPKPVPPATPGVPATPQPPKTPPSTVTPPSAPTTPEPGPSKAPAPAVPPKAQEGSPPKEPESPAKISEGPRRQAVNYTNNGHLESATSLLERQQKYTATPPPFRVLFPSRQRFYATADMVEMIDLLGQYARSLASNLRLLIADVSGPRGGPLFRWDDKAKDFVRDSKGKPILSHGSHQNGLDADIAYLQNSASQSHFLSVVSKESGFNFKKEFNFEAQFKLFKQAVSTSMVDAFWVHSLMKIEMCRIALKEGAFEEGKEDKVTIEMLKRLRIEDKFHDAHFHMRLKCDRKRQEACLTEGDLIAKSHGCVISKKEN